MLLGAVLALVAAAPSRPCSRAGSGWVAAIAIAGFVWSLVVIGLVTLIPAEGAPGIVPPRAGWRPAGRSAARRPRASGSSRAASGCSTRCCSSPPGVLLVVAAARWRWWAVVTVPLGLGLLAAYSAGIEYTQLAVARIDRACDLTDVVDNVTGAAIGVLIGIPLALLLRPWRPAALTSPTLTR